VIRLKLEFGKLTQKNAVIIADEWKYPGIYSFYDMTADEDDYNELIDPDMRGETYFEVLSGCELIGFLTLNISENVADIGIGMRPDLTGRGLGTEFMSSCLNFITKKHRNVKAITLSVACFNIRAIKVYKKLDFKEEYHFDQQTNGGNFKFVSMRKKVSLE
jgi:ribosomal-protein-alanine N-acetyltransferase